MCAKANMSSSGGSSSSNRDGFFHHHSSSHHGHHHSHHHSTHHGDLRSYALLQEARRRSREALEEIERNTSGSSRDREGRGPGSWDVTIRTRADGGSDRGGVSPSDGRRDYFSFVYSD